MVIEIDSSGDLYTYIHTFYQQYQIDNQIDYVEFINRLGWINFNENFVKYESEYTAENGYDDAAINLINTVKNLVSNPPA